MSGRHDGIGNMDARRIVAELGGRWHGDSGVARCPAHDDREPSLSIKKTDEGRLLWHCHAGCSQEAVAAALNARGLLDNASNRERKRTPRRAISKVYDYLGPDGELLYQVVRKHPKTFRQRRPDGKGGWIWNLKGVPSVPYRLPDLIAAKTDQVFVTEGEKDAYALAELGLVATCNPGGAGKWQDHFKGYFEDKRVVVLPDNDEPGRAHAKAVVRFLIDTRKELLARLHELRGKNLACWCSIFDRDGQRVPCHGDPLLELANPGLAVGCELSADG